MTFAPIEDSDQPGHLPVWSESSLYAWRNTGFSATHLAHCEVSDQTGRMPRLIWVFAGCTDHFVCFVMRRLIYPCCLPSLNQVVSYTDAASCPNDVTKCHVSNTMSKLVSGLDEIRFHLTCQLTVLGHKFLQNLPLSFTNIAQKII